MENKYFFKYRREAIQRLPKAEHSKEKNQNPGKQKKNATHGLKSATSHRPRGGPSPPGQGWDTTRMPKK